MLIIPPYKERDQDHNQKDDCTKDYPLAIAPGNALGTSLFAQSCFTHGNLQIKMHKYRVLQIVPEICSTPRGHFVVNGKNISKFTYMVRVSNIGSGMASFLTAACAVYTPPVMKTW